MAETSEAVAAARRRFEEIRATALARTEANVQSALDADKRAAEANKDFTEKVQKIEKRVRERIAEREAAANPKRGAEEIKVGGEDDELETPQDDVAAEFNDLIENYPISKPADPAPAAPEPAPQPTAPAGYGRSAGWQSQPPVPAPAPAPEPQAPAPDSRWQVQAGRFGRRNQQQSQPPAAAPAPQPKPAARKEPPRRRAIEDDDDYENQDWLR
ncbi:hypothetical protein [Saccharopolyspora taberi]|uniref:Translation initiation factor IF-2 n=1 Tax=Saccharopolyspora taberi TaxID=60895 RepID=A0ABN3VJ21_9PSEU